MRFWEEQERMNLGTCCIILSRSLSRGSGRLQDRIKQHLPKSIRSCSSQKRILPASQCKSSNHPNTQSLASDSAIGLHLLQNPACAQHYDDSEISVLAQGSSTFHLPALEASFIKTSNAALCRQKEFVQSLKVVQFYALMTLSHWSFSSQSRFGFFLQIAPPFLTLFILTSVLDKCQTKGCFEDMNILIKAMRDSIQL